jgi:hypothetical protein
MLTRGGFISRLSAALVGGLVIPSGGEVGRYQAPGSLVFLRVLRASDSARARRNLADSLAAADRKDSRVPGACSSRRSQPQRFRAPTRLLRTGCKLGARNRRNRIGVSIAEDWRLFTAHLVLWISTPQFWVGAINIVPPLAKAINPRRSNSSDVVGAVAGPLPTGLRPKPP